VLLPRHAAAQRLRVPVNITRTSVRFVSTPCVSAWRVPRRLFNSPRAASARACGLNAGGTWARAMKKLRIVRLGLGTARQKMVLE
jgi:hypothetical protein